MLQHCLKSTTLQRKLCDLLSLPKGTLVSSVLFASFLMSVARATSTPLAFSYLNRQALGTRLNVVQSACCSFG